MKLIEIQTFSHTSTKPVSNYDPLNLKKQQTNRKTTTTKTLATTATEQISSRELNFLLERDTL